jgi:predicted nucleotidyltransferase
MTDAFLGELKDNGYAQYIRVLGFNEKGRRLLARARKGLIFHSGQALPL